MTPQDLINLALKQAGVLGVGQTATAEDMNDAFTLLQMMLAQWQRRRYIVYHLLDIVVPTTGQQSYTIGPGADIDMPRPGKIVAAFFRQTISAAPFQVDYPLEILNAREDYNQIGIKALASFPQYLFYDSAWPLGNVFIWPIPSPAGLYEVHLTVMEQLQQFADQFDDFNLPPEYQEAIMYNLALRLYPMYKLPVDPAVAALARASLNILEAANVQIPRLRIDPTLNQRGHYNIFADRVK